MSVLSFRRSVETVMSNRNLMVITLSQSLGMFAMFLWRPFWGLYLLELGASKGILGALSSLQALCNLLLQLPGGMLADRYGRRKIILFSALFGFIPPLIFRFSTHWTMLIPGIFAYSLSSIAIPARSALIAESLSDENRATGFGAYSMATYLFIVAAYPFGGYIQDSMGVVEASHLGFIASFLVLVPSIILQWRYLVETRGEASLSRLGVRESLGKLRGAPREIWKLILVAVLSSFGFQIFWSFVVVYCIEELGMTKMQWSIASIVANFVGALFMIPSGFLSDRARRKPYIILSQALVSFSSLGYVLSTGFQSLVVTRLIGGVGEGLGGNVMGSMGGPVWNALVNEVAPADYRGSVLGMMGTMTGLIVTPAPMLGGYLYENFSPQTPFYASLALGITGCLIFTLFVKESPREEVPQADLG
jgi:MFS family permease